MMTLSCKIMAFWMHCLHSRLGENVINSNLILLNTTIVFLLFSEETSAGGFSRQEKGKLLDSYVEAAN